MSPEDWLFRLRRVSVTKSDGIRVLVVADHASVQANRKGLQRELKRMNPEDCVSGYEEFAMEYQSDSVYGMMTPTGIASCIGDSEFPLIRFVARRLG